MHHAGGAFHATFGPLECSATVMTHIDVHGDKPLFVDVLTTGFTPQKYIQWLLATQMKNEDEPFYVVDLGRVLNRYDKWTSALPGVQPFYAVKCNPDRAIIKTLAALGAGFDCASMNEMMTVLQLGVAPEKIIYAQTIKPVSHLKYAMSQRVSTLTFDNQAEIYKIKEHFPSAKLILRVATITSEGVYSLSEKFGCSVAVGKELLLLCKELNMNVIGFSFHAGWLCDDASVYSDALMKCSELFHYGSALGYDITLLDIGGGFPGAKGSDDQFELMSAKILETLDLLFNASSNPGLQVIAEPGTFFGCSALSLAVRIIGKRVTSTDQKSKKVEYYISDGVYGSFSTVVSCHVLPGASPLPVQQCHSEKEYETTIWGPTCDSLDKVCTLTMAELDIGDYLWFDDMGSYTTSTSSSFNGYGTYITAYYINESIRARFEQLHNGK